MAIFRIFSKTIEGLPVQAVIRALEAECQMLMDDLTRHGRKLTDDAHSILAFGEYVHMVQTGNVTRCARMLPPEHLEFYLETIDRLVKAGELPPLAMDKFDEAFSLKK